MFLGDHQRLDQPRMVCPMLPREPSGMRCECLRDQCALWYREKNPDYSGCSLYITAHAARGIGYHVSVMADR